MKEKLIQKIIHSYAYVFANVPDCSRKNHLIFRLEELRASMYGLMDFDVLSYCDWKPIDSFFEEAIYCLFNDDFVAFDDLIEDFQND